MSDSHRIRAFISGYVQGVGYRAFVQQQARRLGLTGYARNLRDARVEVVAEGAKEKLEELLPALRRGPHGSSVENVTFDWHPPTGEFHTFGVRF